MKIEIEKVQKVKAFEPFILKIQFDEVEEARDFLQIFHLIAEEFPPGMYDKNGYWELLKNSIRNELTKQEFKP